MNIFRRFNQSKFYANYKNAFWLSVLIWDRFNWDGKLYTYVVTPVLIFIKNLSLKGPWQVRTTIIHTHIHINKYKKNIYVYILPVHCNNNIFIAQIKMSIRFGSVRYGTWVCLSQCSVIFAFSSRGFLLSFLLTSHIRAVRFNIFPKRFSACFVIAHTHTLTHMQAHKQTCKDRNERKSVRRVENKYGLNNNN